MQKYKPDLMGAEVAFGGNATGVHARNDGLEPLRAPLPVRIEGLTEFVVRHVGRQVQKARPPPHCPHPHLRSNFHHLHTPVFCGLHVSIVVTKSLLELCLPL